MNSFRIQYLISLFLLIFAGIAFLDASSTWAQPSASVGDLVRQARTKAQECDIRDALDDTEVALAIARRNWKTDAPDFLFLLQDVATYANQLLQFDTAAGAAQEALKFAVARSGQTGREQAIVSQNLAVALAGMGDATAAAAIFDRILDQLKAAGDNAALVNAEIAASDFAFNRGQPQSGLARAEAAAAIADAELGLPLKLRLSAYLRLAEARGRLLDVAGANQAADKAKALIVTPGLDATVPRLALIRAGIAYEKGALRDAMDIVTRLESQNLPHFPCDPTLRADIAERRATIHMVRRELPEAEAAYADALKEIDAIGLTLNPREGEIIYGLAVIAGMAGDDERSAMLFDNAVASFRKVHGGPSEAEAQTLIEKAYMLSENGRATQGVAIARRAVSLLQGPLEQSRLSIGYAHAALGLTSLRAGDFTLARTELHTAITEFEAARGKDSFDLTPGLNALGEIEMAEGHSAAAQRLFERAAGNERMWGGASSLTLGRTLSNLAQALAAAGDRKRAIARSGEAISILQRRIAIGETRPWNDAQAERLAARAMIERDMGLSLSQVASGWPVDDRKLLDRLLTAAQLANAASTGGAIAQMAERVKTRDPQLSAMLRERNDLSAEWRSIQDQLTGLLAQNGIPDGPLRSKLLQLQNTTGARIAYLDKGLVAKDPRLDLLIKSRIVGLDDLQATINPREAAIVLILAKDCAYTIAVKQDSAIAFRTLLTREKTTQLVSRIRDTVDLSRLRFELPSYDTEAAYALYASLLAPAKFFLKDVNTLVFVPDGALASIPTSIWLSAPAHAPVAEKDYSALPWLIKRYAVESFPSVASIVILRKIEHQSVNGAGMLGIGDPEFNGSLKGEVRSAEILRSLANDRLAEVEFVRKLPPLPDTRTEVEAIATALNNDRSRLLLGPHANESEVRSARFDGLQLAIFATHALVAGQLNGFAEPGLALTPPLRPTVYDDGILAASEVASMRIDVEWVILSACNTAASDGSPRAEPLSGLAKSFFYSGARSLLVSHWPVDSSATASLTVSTVTNAKTAPSHAMALRETMLAFIKNKDGSSRTHPFFWAPFELVGD